MSEATATEKEQRGFELLIAEAKLAPAETIVADLVEHRDLWRGLSFERVPLKQLVTIGEKIGRVLQSDMEFLTITAAGGSEYELQELARGWSTTAAWQEGSLTMCWSPERRAGR